MARQIIDLGTSPNRGDGDPLRTAFDKVNDNFAELYAGNFAEPSATASSLIPDVDGTYDLGSADNQWADLHVADFIYLNSTRLEVDANGNLRVGGALVSADTQGSVFADDSSLLIDAVNGKIVGPIESPTITSSSYVDASSVNANVYGAKTIGSFINFGVNASSINVTADISMLNNNITNVGSIAGYISTADLQTLVAASADFADFQARIAAL